MKLHLSAAPQGSSPDSSWRRKPASFSLAPKNKPTVIRTFMRRLRIDSATAEEGYADLHRAVDRRPYASADGMRNVQRLMALRNPKIAEVKIDNVIDNRIIKKLEDSGFIDKAYAAQGTSAK